jgi:hypothetical protein
VVEIVSLKELLRFVHFRGQGGAALEWVAARQLALITVAQLHEPVGAADTSAHRASSAPDWPTGNSALGRLGPADRAGAEFPQGNPAHTRPHPRTT